MSATITSNAGGIKRSGVTVENEPIIKSDGAGEVMQWKPSDDGADGVFITETGSIAGLQLGIGGTPVGYHDDADNFAITDAANCGMTIAAGTTANSAIYFADGTAGAAAYVGQIKYVHGSTNELQFYTSGTKQLTIGSGGGITIGSLDIGHGAGGVTNTAVGTDALDNSHATATHNTAIGNLALTAIHTDAADYNTAVGSKAGEAITSGAQNTAIGAYCLDACTVGNNNTGLGVDCLGAAAVNDNTGLGHNALNAFTGSNATAVGSGAADAATSANQLVAVGKDAAGVITTATDVTAIGYQSLNAVTTTTLGSYSTAVGSFAGLNLIRNSNTAIGYGAAYNVGYGTRNTAIGKNTMLGASAASGHIDSCAHGTSATTITCTSNAIINTYQRVTGTNIAEGTYVTAITGGYGTVTSFVISQATTNDSGGSLAGQTLTFYQTNADDCVAVGLNALASITTGGTNVAVGNYAGTALTTGFKNVFVGYGAGKAADDDSYSVAIGYDALVADAASSGSIAIGYQALEDQNTASSNNVAIGYQAARNLDGGTDSVYVGYLAGGIGAITGGFNTCLGYSAGYALTGGASNVLIGKNAGVTLQDGSNNIAIGHGALDAANGTTAGADIENFNIAVGTNALGAENSGAEYCVAIGDSALILQDADVKNTAIGGLAGAELDSGSGNTLVGYKAGNQLDGAEGGNTFIGHEAARNADGAENNVAVGYGAIGDGTATGNGNVAIGYQAGKDLTDGPGNVLVGRDAGKAMTTSDYNVAIGAYALDALTTDSHNNIAIGAYALSSQETDQTTGSITNGTVNSIAIGRNALGVQDGADAINLAIGYNAGLAVSTGTRNVLIGHEAGTTLAAHHNSTAVGYNALKLSATHSNTAVGAWAAAHVSGGGSNVVMGDSALYIANGGEAQNTVIGTSAFYNLDDDTADDNVALGMNAGRWDAAGTTDGTTASPADGLVLATQCTYLGTASRASHNGVGVGAIITNEIAIGYGTIGIGNHSVALGNTSIANIDGQVAFGTYSDRRIKRDIVNNDTGLALIEKLQPVTYKPVNPADYPEAISEARFKEGTNEQLVTPAVEAAEAVYEDAIVQEARDAIAEETREEVHPAIEEVTEEVTIPAVAEVTEERVTQEAREEIKSTRHKHSEVEVTETVTGEEIVEVDGKWVKRATSEEVTRTERTPVYEDCDLYDEDGSICTHCVTPAVEAKDAVVDEDGNEIEPAVEAVAEVRANDVHRVPVMEEYISQTAQEEVRETFVVQEAVAERTETRVVVEAADEWTETHITRPAEAAVEEVTERRLVSAAVEAKDAVYETVTVPADDRPADDDTVRLGLIAQDVQTAMTEAGVEFDIVNESPNGKLSLKYGNLVMPLIKAVQELSARVKTLEG